MYDYNADVLQYAYRDPNRKDPNATLSDPNTRKTACRECVSEYAGQEAPKVRTQAASDDSDSDDEDDEEEKVSHPSSIVFYCISSKCCFELAVAGPCDAAPLRLKSVACCFVGKPSGWQQAEERRGKEEGNK